MGRRVIVAGSDNQPTDDAAMRARLAALKNDLASGTRPPPPSATERSLSGTGSALNLGARVMTEFVAAIAVSAFIGWNLDRWLGTTPFPLILFVALGTAAGFWSVYRVATKPAGK